VARVILHHGECEVISPLYSDVLIGGQSLLGASLLTSLQSQLSFGVLSAAQVRLGVSVDTLIIVCLHLLEDSQVRLVSMVGLGDQWEIELSVLTLFVVSDQGTLNLLVVNDFVHCNRCRVDLIINRWFIGAIHESVIIHISKDISPILSALNQILRFVVCAHQHHP